LTAFNFMFISFNIFKYLSYWPTSNSSNLNTLNSYFVIFTYLLSFSSFRSIASRGATPTKISAKTLKAVVATLTFWAFASMKTVSSFLIYIYIAVHELQVTQWYYWEVISCSWFVHLVVEIAKFAYQDYVIL
jgi:hypothetical protein